MNDEERAVSVIIPARDEELNIEGVVRSLAGQRGVREIIVADDQSRDRTAEILDRLAHEFPFLVRLPLEALPAGWRGKTHAAAEGAKRAVAPWLLFADADTRYKPCSVTSLLRLAESSGANMLSVSPAQHVETWYEKSVIPLMFSDLAHLFPFDAVNDPNSPVAAANGQCILVRRSVYDEIGGFEAVRSDILEDVELAKRVKRSGARLLFLPGSEWVETRMYRSFGAMWQGWTKNLFLLYGRKRGKIALAAARHFALDSLPVILIIIFIVLIAAGHLHAWIAIAWIVCAVVVLVRQRSLLREFETLGFRTSLRLYGPLGGLLLALMMINSLRAYRRGGSIEWKGRIYSTNGEKS